MAHPALSDGRWTKGFVFDAVEDPADQSVRFIEVNGCGSLNGCGACVFD